MHVATPRREPGTASTTMIGTPGKSSQVVTPRQSVALAADVTRFESILLENQTHQSSISDEVQQITAAYAHVRNDLDYSKEHFSKLKFNLVELETKYRFLSHLKNLEGAFDVQELECAVESEKKNVQLLKKKNFETCHRIEQLCNELGDHYEPSLECVTDLKELLEKVVTIRGQVRELRRQKVEPQYIGDVQITLSNATEILEGQVQKMVQLQADEQKCKTDVADLRWQVTEINTENEALQAEAQKIQAKLSVQEEDGDSHAAIAKGLNEKKLWYAQMLTVVRKMAQTSVRLDGARMNVDITTINRVTADTNTNVLAIELNKSLSQIVGATLTPSGGVDISDILREARERNDVAFLVREVRHGIGFVAAIASEVEMLKETYFLEWSSKTCRLNARLSNGGSVKLQLQDRVTEPGYIVRVIEHTASRLRPAASAELLQAKCHAAGVTNSLKLSLDTLSRC